MDEMGVLELDAVHVVVRHKYSSTPHFAGRFLMIRRNSVPRFEMDILIYSYHIAFRIVSRKSRYLVSRNRDPFLDAALNESSPLSQVYSHNIPDLFVVNQADIDRSPSQENLSEREVVLRNFLERNFASVK